MKKFIWLLFALFVLSCSRAGEIRVRGKVENGDRIMIYLDEQGLHKITNVDSTKLKRDGSFDLKDRIEAPTFYNLHLGNRNIIPLLIKPGDIVEVITSDSGFVADYQLSGSEESLHLLSLNKRMSQTKKSLDSLTLIFEQNQGAGEDILVQLQEEYSDVIQSQRRYSIQFVLEHMTSMASIYAIYQRIDEDEYVLNTFRDVQILKITGEALDTIYPESEYVKSLIHDAANLENEMKRRNWQQVLEETSSALPEIRLPEPHGDTIALSSLRGKVILLSFWASWNEESVNLNQEFLRLYNKYHGRGLEIYQVSFDTELSDWMTAINYDELPWINVSELSYPESAVAPVYNVTDLPTFYLVDRQGQITGRNYDLIILDRKISELINQN
ncbi:thioredoxin-like domain-containing protein [Bacteroidota bacterium]